KLTAPELPGTPLETPPDLPANGGLRLGLRRSLWSGPATKYSPVLAFLEPQQTVELNPADAERLGLHPGEPVRVGSNGTRVNATVALRAAVPAGTAFLVEDGAALATGGDVEVSPA